MTHIVFTSVAARIERGEYLPHRALPVGVGANNFEVPAIAGRPAREFLPYVGAGLMGAALVLAFFV